MAENKKGFVLYADIIHTVKKMTDEKAGILLKTILSYVNDEDLVVDDIIVDLVFEPIKRQLKRDLEKYEEKKHRLSLNGQKGGLKSGESRKQTEAIASNASPNEAIDAEEPNNIVVRVSAGLTKEEKIAKRLEREKVFYDQIAVYAKQYDAKMLREFYDYWREPTKSERNMKWETEKTWSLDLRLKKWQSNDDKWNNNRTANNPQSNELSEGAKKLKELMTNTPT